MLASLCGTTIVEYIGYNIESENNLRMIFVRGRKIKMFKSVRSKFIALEIRCGMSAVMAGRLRVPSR